MKKITLFVALICSLSAFSTRYLIQGTTGTNTWRTAGAGEVNVTTSDFRSWYYTTFLSGYTYNADDEIWLAGGTYILSYSFGTRKVNVYGGFSGTETAIAQRSKVLNGKAWEFTTPTILDGNLTSPQGFTSLGIATTPITYIDGVTITRCKITNVTSTIYGVGAYITQGCVMQNCIVSNNTYSNTAATNAYEGKGGGIYLTGGQVLNSYISDNQMIKGNGGSTYGGGIAFAYTSESALNIVNGCTIENNTSTTYGGGVAIINGSGGTIENCIFKSNSTVGSGGGLSSANNSGTSAFNLKNCQFIENTSTATTATSNTGGAGGADLFLTGTTTIEGCSFIGNTGFNVGGLSFRAGTNMVKNCIFRNNKNTDASNLNYDASALFSMIATTTVQNCVFANNSSVANTNKNHTIKLTVGGVFYNCTVVNNSEPGSAGYTFTFNGSVGTIKNCVFLGNVNTANFSGVGNNGISNYNATTSDRNTNGTAGGGSTGNITTLTASNTFVFPTTFTGVPSTIDGGVQKAASAAADWRLKIGSPAINSGIDLAGSGITTDILGNARPTGASAVDMGAYEAIVVPGTNNISTLTTTSATDLTIPAGGHLTVNVSRTLGNITVESGGKLTNATEQTLTLTTLKLKSDANGTGTYVDNGTSVITTANVQQYLSSARNWYMSSPISNATAPAGYVYYQYNEPGGNTNLILAETAYWRNVPTDASLTAGRGYITQSASSSSTISFTGALNTASLPIALSRTVGATKEGFNLIGNPYTSYLDWSMVDTTATNITTSIWYRTKTASNTYTFDTYNRLTNVGTSLGANTITNLIPPMQAFWVRAKLNGGALTLTKAMCKHIDVAGNKFKAPVLMNNNLKVMRLRISNGIHSDETIILYHPNALDTYDDYDSPKMSNNTVSVPEIYTETGAEKLVINGMNVVKYDTEIPLGFSTLQTNDFSISITEMSNFEEGTKLFLKDKLLNIETEIGVGAAYSFSSQITDPTTGRFSLSFRSPKSSTNLNNTKELIAHAFVNSVNQITIIAQENTVFDIFNSLGQKQFSSKLSTTKMTINKIFFPGVYFIELYGNGQRETKKVVVR